MHRSVAVAGDLVTIFNFQRRCLSTIQTNLCKLCGRTTHTHPHTHTYIYIYICSILWAFCITLFNICAHSIQREFVFRVGRLRAGNCGLIRVALSQSAWRVLRAETRLTVYRPFAIQESTMYVVSNPALRVLGREPGWRFPARLPLLVEQGLFPWWNSNGCGAE